MYAYAHAHHETVNARRDRPKIDSIDFQNDTANPNSNIIAGIFGGGRRGFFEYEKQIKLTKRILFVITSRDIFSTYLCISIYIQFLLEQMRKLKLFLIQVRSTFEYKIVCYSINKRWRKNCHNLSIRDVSHIFVKYFHWHWFMLILDFELILHFSCSQ